MFSLFAVDVDADDDDELSKHSGVSSIHDETASAKVVGVICMVLCVKLPLALVLP